MQFDWNSGMTMMGIVTGVSSLLALIFVMVATAERWESGVKITTSHKRTIIALIIVACLSFLVVGGFGSDGSCTHHETHQEALRRV